MHVTHYLVANKHGASKKEKMTFAPKKLKMSAVANQVLELNGFDNVSLSIVHPLNVRQWDILCGKSSSCVQHDGSRRFRAVIECHREVYQQALTKVCTLCNIEVLLRLLLVLI